MKKTLTRVMVSALFALAAVVGIQVPAYAVQGYIDAPTGFSGQGWYAFDPVNDTLAVEAIPLGIPAGYCLTIYLDPSRNGGESDHYDIRMARTCTQAAGVASGLQYEGATYGVNLTGINKLSVCMAPDNVALSHPSTRCRHVVGALSGVNAVLPGSCARAWVRSSSGVYGYVSGGSPTSCTS